MAGDVHRDTGERERGPEADAERDHTHVLEARVGEQSLPRQREPEERHGDCQRPEAEGHEDSMRRRFAEHRRKRLARSPRDEQHGGKERCREQRRDGSGRLRVRVRQPVVHRCPADLRREPGEQEQVRDERRMTGLNGG